jgi:hypothetical protein
LICHRYNFIHHKKRRIARMNFHESIAKLIVSFKEKAKDGISVKEFFALLTEFADAAVILAAQLREPGEKKKEFVLHYVSELYDQIAPLVPMPFPLSLIRPFVRKPIKDLVMAAADAAIELAYQKLLLKKD